MLVCENLEDRRTGDGSNTAISRSECSESRPMQQHVDAMSVSRAYRHSAKTFPGVGAVARRRGHEKQTRRELGGGQGARVSTSVER